MRIILNARDKQLFRTIDAYGLLSTSQLKRILFQNTDDSTVLRRLRKLKGKQYLHSYIGLPQGQLVWTLALKARQVIDSDLEVNVNKNQLEHDVLISDIRKRLEDKGVASSWISGQRLKQMASKQNNANSVGTSQIPDSIFSVQTTAGPLVVALELELVSKSKRRYRDILRNYSYGSKINWVWYVLEQSSLGSFLTIEANSIERADGKTWLYTSPLSQVLDENAAIVLKNQDKSILLMQPAQPSAQGLGKQK